MMERKMNLNLTEIILFAGTRVALGIGLGLLLSRRLNRDQSKAAGVALALVGAAFVTRGAQPNPGASAAPQAAPQPAAPSGRAPQPTAPAASAKATPAAKQPAAAASEAPIQDEPTVAPDSQQSEDNSVTFPADI